MQHGDGADCCRIWIAGLEQTCEQSNFIMRPIFRSAFAGMARKMTSPDGDFGVDGENIERNYFADHSDRIMMVAVLTTTADSPSGESGGNSASVTVSVSGRVVGCLCVKRGTSESLSEIAHESETVFTVNRVSVDASARNLKVGTKLMNEAEKWAKARGATKMSLHTGNPIASKFYVKLNYEKIGFFGVLHEKDLIEAKSI